MLRPFTTSAVLLVTLPLLSWPGLAAYYDHEGQKILRNCAFSGEGTVNPK